jgi:hypothetical protein
VLYCPVHFAKVTDWKAVIGIAETKGSFVRIADLYGKYATRGSD